MGSLRKRCTLSSLKDLRSLAASRMLYGLKQAPHAWYTWIDNYFTRLGFTKSEADANLYQIVVEGNLLIIVIYVNDLILTSDEQLMHYARWILQMSLR